MLPKEIAGIPIEHPIDPSKRDRYEGSVEKLRNQVAPLSRRLW